MDLNQVLQNPIITLFVVSIIILTLIYRQTRPRKLSLKGLVIFPLITLFLVLWALPTFHPGYAGFINIVVTSIVSAVLGLLACRQLYVYKGASGKAMAKSNWTYFLWWLAAFIIKAFLAVILRETPTHNINQTEILLPVFILLLTRNTYLYWKVTKLQLTLH